MFRKMLYIKSKHILCSVTVLENRAFFSLWKDLVRGGQATNNNMAYARFMLDA